MQRKQHITWIRLGVFAVAIVGAVLLIQQHGLSSKYRSNAAIAADTLTRLHDASRESAGYTLRLVEAEQAFDAAKRSVKNEADKKNASTMEIWFNTVKAEHDWHELESQISALHARGAYSRVEYANLTEEREARDQELRTILRVCEDEVRAAFSGKEPGDRCHTLYTKGVR